MKTQKKYNESCINVFIIHATDIGVKALITEYHKRL